MRPTGSIVTLESLGGHLGMVFQGTFLFHTSLGDNLSLRASRRER